MNTTGPARDRDDQPEPEPDARPHDSGDSGASVSPPPRRRPRGYGTAGGYAWIDPYTGLPTARYQPPPGQDGYGAAYSGRTTPLAIAALLCGVLQFLVVLVINANIVLAIPAVIFAIIALRRISSSGDAGRGMAVAGLVLGILGIIYFVLIVVHSALGSGTT